MGDADAKLRWARAAGAVAGFTWLPVQHVEFTARSGIPHYRLPFGVDAALYGRHEKELVAGTAQQPYDIGFTGASNHKYPLREACSTSSARSTSNRTSARGSRRR